MLLASVVYTVHRPNRGCALLKLLENGTPFLAGPTPVLLAHVERLPALEAFRLSRKRCRQRRTESLHVPSTKSRVACTQRKLRLCTSCRASLLNALATVLL
ncbi:hypothetical protein GUJ93_ZPchr0013g35765 [Zizania palustris]|uniref:Uncharacterized protein n=1 Tax=Zizania palustris TaxID=103762 RepID=A0A8J5WYD6_ZIZPA|nr:hypothetical protein GUJ93_ZPchr0013g35765 [Zizania palustris]